MALFWVFEIIPIAVTALIPLILFPLLKILPVSKAAFPYGDKIVFLFLGGFFIAKAMEKHNLHRRISLFFVSFFPKTERGILLGFMLTVGFLSAWMSNTATTIMALPIVLAIFKTFDRNTHPNFEKSLLIGIAYAASMGGISTPVGTPPNLIFLGTYPKLFPSLKEISFLKWMIFAVPFSITFIFIGWIFLNLFFLRKTGSNKISARAIGVERKKLGRIKLSEKIVLGVFVGVAFLWLTRKGISFGNFAISGWEEILNLKGYTHDSVIAVLGALLLFLIPTRENGVMKPVLNWESALKIPWGVLLIFGGGFSLANAFKETGLTDALGKYLYGLKEVPIFMFVIFICLFVTFLTEVTSNTATTTILIPFLGALSKAVGLHPFILMIPAVFSASCAFMLPSATPPNAIVFAGGNLKVKDMAKTGFILNLIGALLITLFFYFLIKPILGI